MESVLKSDFFLNSSILLDTLRLSKLFKESDFTEKQSEILSEVIKLSQEGHETTKQETVRETEELFDKKDLATRQDLMLVKQDLMLVKQDLMSAKQELMQELMVVKQDLMSVKQDLTQDLMSVKQSVMLVRQELMQELMVVKHDVVLVNQDLKVVEKKLELKIEEVRSEIHRTKVELIKWTIGLLLLQTGLILGLIKAFFVT